MSVIKWDTPSSLIDTSTTAFNSITSNSTCEVVVDNTTGKDLYYWFELVLTPSATVGATPYVGVEVFANISGTAPDRVAGAGFDRKPNLPVSAGSGAKRLTFDFVLPPYSNTLVFNVQLGVAVSATGNTLKYKTNDENVT